MFGGVGGLRGGVGGVKEELWRESEIKIKKGDGEKEKIYRGMSVMQS